MLSKTMDVKSYDTVAVVAKLKEYGELVKDYGYECERLERLKTKMIGLGGQVISDMPKSPSPSSDRMTDYVAQKVELEEELGEALVEIETKRKEIERAIKSLKKAQERAVIRHRYIDQVSYRDVNELLFGDKDDFLGKEESYLRRTFSIHKAALQGLAEYFGLYEADTSDQAEA